MALTVVVDGEELCRTARPGIPELAQSEDAHQEPRPEGSRGHPRRPPELGPQHPHLVEVDVPAERGEPLDVAHLDGTRCARARA